MRHFYLHVLGLAWCLALFAAMSFKVHLERDYPYMNHPIEAVAVNLDYFPNKFHLANRELGSMELRDSIYVLSQYSHRDSGRLSISKDQIENIQLSFSFIHYVPNSKTAFSPWRTANEGGILLGDHVPLYVKRIDGGPEKGPFMATTLPLKEFKFSWGFDSYISSLDPGIYALRLAISEADIPFHQRKRVETLFSPNFYPNYFLYLEVPE